VLKALASAAGRTGKCRKCGQSITVPPMATPLHGAAAVAVVPPAGRVLTKCGVCQSRIEVGEAETICSECGTRFHTDCWQANQGCAVYGCANVHILKPGPDIRIGTAGWAAVPLPGINPPGTAIPNPGMRAASPLGGERLPWEFVLLAAAGLGTLLGLFTCGCPAFLAGGGALAYLLLSKQNPRRVILFICLGLSLLGMLLGLVTSIFIWA
jgi:hypothetical protein